MDDLPAEVRELIGKPCFAQVSDGKVETGAIRFFVSAIGDGAPRYWDDDPATIEAPSAMLSAWNRPLMWKPKGKDAEPGLALHFKLKELLELPMAVVKETESEVALPMRVGEQVLSEQTLVSISDAKQTRLGSGRFWEIRIDYSSANGGGRFGSEFLTFFAYRKTEGAA